MFRRRKARIAPNEFRRVGAVRSKADCAWGAKEPGAAEEEQDRQAVAVEVPVPNRSRGPGMVFEDRGIQGETDEGETEQSDADITQAPMRHDAEQPKKSETLKAPSPG